MVRALASLQCGAGSNSGVDAICMLSDMWVELVVGSLPLPSSKRFFSGYSGFLLSSKTNISKFQFDQESGGRRTTMCGCATCKSLSIYLFYLFTRRVSKIRGYFAGKKENTRWIQPLFGRKHIYLIQLCQNEKVSHS